MEQIGLVMIYLAAIFALMAFLEGITLDDSLNELPSDVDPATEAHQLALYRQFSNGTSGMAKFYAANHSDVVFTTSMVSGSKDRRRMTDAIYVFNSENQLWEQADYEIWMPLMRAWFLPHIKEISDFIGSRLGQERADDPKSEACRAWSRTFASIKDASKVILNKNIREVVNDAFTLLRQDSLAMRLNPPTPLLAFTNGNVELHSGNLVARTAADYMTCCIPYPYDPTADMGPAIALWKSYFPDPETFACSRKMFGLFITPDTHHKAFFQIIELPNAGKTAIKTLLIKTLGPYITDSVQVKEWREGGTGFKDDLAEALSSTTKVIRIVWFDDPGELEVDVALLNGLTAGTDIRVQLSQKFKGSAATSFNCQVHVVFSGNTALKFPPKETGTALRNKGIPLTRRFLTPEQKAPFVPWIDPSLALRQSFVRFLVSSAASYLNTLDEFTHLPALPTCTSFNIATAKLLIASSEYLIFLTTHYSLSNEYVVPPGGFPCTHRTSYKEMATALIDSKQFPKRNASAVEGFTDACAAMSNVLYPCSWMDMGDMHVGVAGLRRRIVGDPPWVEQMSMAEMSLKAVRAILVAQEAAEDL